MFHYTAIYFTFLFIRRLPLGANALLWNVVFYGSTIALTILASAVSYRYFEAFFLNQKSKLMVIKSSDGTA
jgi:peptidoglycan/LPS O-acetylase OafA/YrhL